jgi:cytochrome c peroxidase
MPTVRPARPPSFDISLAVWLAAPLAVLLATLLSITPARAQSPYAQRFDVPRLTALGRSIFFDAELSPSGAISCASCHDPKHAYGPPDADVLHLSFRAAPSLRYLNSLPPFSEHTFDNDLDEGSDLGPTGGHTWDGRVSSAHEQARLPLLSPDEMGGPTAGAVVARLRAAPYAAQLRALFGADVFDRPERAFEAALMALEVFQQSPADFYPFSSRYDAMLRGRGTLSAQELRGLALFSDPAKGNCASCHLSSIRPDGAFPLFTDFGHIAIGVPRNPAIKANADPAFVDLGLCGPLRTDLADHADDCGRFRAPSLRNVALRQRFFHNGAIRSLEDAVRFYVQRDTDPARWYGAAGALDELPARYRANLNTDPPFGGHPGDAPALTEAEIADVVAFLETLTDADQLAHRTARSAGPEVARHDGSFDPRRECGHAQYPRRRCNRSSRACSTPTSTSSRCGRRCCTATRRPRPSTPSCAATSRPTRSWSCWPT